MAIVAHDKLDQLPQQEQDAVAQAMGFRNHKEYKDFCDEVVERRAPYYEHLRRHCRRV
jgi:hypothetical protein